jgi:glycosyltransferase involved in cell wall biosynthesis
MEARTLYICYFGLREPLVQTQVLPYLRRLAAGGVGVHLLTFEPDRRAKWTGQEIEEQRAKLAAEGISWHSLAYHKSPSLPATLYDIVAGALAAARIVRKNDVDVIHARSHVAAAMGAAAKRLTRRPLIFDIRGFLPEEYVDAGVWPAGGRLYHLAKRAERRLLDASDGFVVLTKKAREILFPGYDDSDASDTSEASSRPVEVIPCCVDMSRFQPADRLSRDAVREELGVAGRRVFVYVGALGGWYLTDETADVLAAAHREAASTFSLVLTQSRPEIIADALRARGVAEENFLIRKVSPAEVPRYLRAADVAVSFIKPCYSKLSSSPTKLAEYLASGLPVICNAGVGDVDELVEGERVGIILRELNEGAYRRALEEVEALRREGGIAERCREVAVRHFDLERVGGERYLRLYSRVLSRRECGGSPAKAACV